jgi:hypothetical protein
MQSKQYSTSYATALHSVHYASRSRNSICCSCGLCSYKRAM